MAVELPQRQAVPQITVIVSGIYSEIPETNGEDVIAAAMEGGGQVAEPSGVLVNKDEAGVFSRRIIALEHRMDCLERQMRNLKSMMNGKLSKTEDRLKALSKMQQEMLRKLYEMDSLQPVPPSASSGLSSEHSSNTRFAGIIDNLPLIQKRRMWAAKASVSFAVSQIRRGKHPRPVKPRPIYKSSFLKYYKRMKAKQAAHFVSPPAGLDGPIPEVIPLVLSSHELRLDDNGSSASTSSRTVENQRS